MYPKLTVDLEKIARNTRVVTRLCREAGLAVTAVTKVFGGEPAIARVLAENGADSFGDSQCANLARLEGLGLPRWMIRIPAPSEAERVVACGEGSLNSDVDTLRALNRAARAQGKRHQVVLMLDLGDLREGFLSAQELLEAGRLVRDELPGLELAGVGVNLTCFSFVQPDTEKLSRLVEVASALNLPEPMVSGGNSATLDLMLRGGIPRGVTHLRLGESLLFGRERAQYRYLEGTENDAFLLSAEVVECRDKPSLPMGTIGRDSYGHRPTFTDRGLRRRAICAIGRQSVDCETMWPVDPGVEILGASSDHLMLDVTDSRQDYRAGDVISFRLGYFATMRAFTSPYVTREYLPCAQTRAAMAGAPDTLC